MHATDWRSSPVSGKSCHSCSTRPRHAAAFSTLPPCLHAPSPRSAEMSRSSGSDSEQGRASKKTTKREPKQEANAPSAKLVKTDLKREVSVKSERSKSSVRGYSESRSSVSPDHGRSSGSAAGDAQTDANALAAGDGPRKKYRLMVRHPKTGDVVEATAADIEAFKALFARAK